MSCFLDGNSRTTVTRAEKMRLLNKYSWFIIQEEDGFSTPATGRWSNFPRR